jgi:cytochrome c oxidase cbb3-type subunit 3
MSLIFRRTRAPLTRASIATIFAFSLTSIALAQRPPFPKKAIDHGHEYFEQHCAFCHGRDAGGGETGPDLTRSKVVGGDVRGDKIGALVHAGRVDKGMPAFDISEADLAGLTAYLHTQKMIADSQKGGRKGVDVSDLQTGNAEAGKAYFNGAGTCSNCHSATGDLAQIATKYEGLKLEERMLFPQDAPAKVTVQLKSGESVTGQLGYLDEFTVGLYDHEGHYHSWPAKAVKYSVDDPAAQHAELLGKYTDDDIHNLMAYLQTLH